MANPPERDGADQVKSDRQLVARRGARNNWREGTPSEWLFQLRQKRGWTLKEVEEKSLRIAQELNNMEFYISGARLSQIENGSTIPSIYKLSSLSRIYGVEYAEFLSAYGIKANQEPVSPDSATAELNENH